MTKLVKLYQWIRRNVLGQYSCNIPFAYLTISGVVHANFKVEYPSARMVYVYEGRTHLEYGDALSDLRKDAPTIIKKWLEQTGLQYQVFELYSEFNHDVQYAFRLSPRCFKWYRKQIVKG